MQREKFAHQWVGNIIGSIEAHLNEATKMRLMESCGRACARSGALASARKCGSDLDALLTTLAGWIGEGNVRREGAVVHLVYQQCYCHLPSEVTEELAATFCYCSRGWIKELFETVLGHPVEVEIVESIRRGAEQCRFTVQLEP